MFLARQSVEKTARICQNQQLDKIWHRERQAYCKTAAPAVDGKLSVLGRKMLSSEVRRRPKRRGNPNPQTPLQITVGAYLELPRMNKNRRLAKTMKVLQISAVKVKAPNTERLLEGSELAT